MQFRTSELALGGTDRWARDQELAPALGKILGGYTSAERHYCFLYGVEYLKHREQLGDLKQIAHTLRKSRQLDCAPAVTRCRIQGYQRSQPAAIDVIHPAQVEHNVVVLRDQVLHVIAQAGRFFAKHDAAFAVHDHHSVDGSGTKSELHGKPSLPGPRALTR